MKKLLLALALCLLPSLAMAQCNGVFANGTVCGNITGAANTPRQTPTSAFGLSPGGTSGQIQYNNGAGGLAGFTTSSDATINTTTGALILSPSGVTAGTYGSAGVIPQFTVDSKGRITGVTSIAVPAPPGGRLTLVSGQPEMVVDVSSQNVYYAPDTGNSCPIYNGTTWASYQFTSGPTDQVGLTLPLAASANWPAGTIFDVFCILNAGLPVLATRAWDSSMLPAFVQISTPSLTVITTGTSGSTWSNTANAFNGTLSQPATSSATVTPASANLNNCLGQDLGSGNTAVLTKVALTEPNNASFRGDDPTTVVMDTYGSNDNTNWQRIDPTRNILSTAATYGATYTYFINALDTTAYRYFRVCTTGDGTHANRFAQIQFFATAAPSTRRLNHFNGILTNDATITARISASTTLSVPVNQATYLGSFQTDASTAGQVTANFGYGPNRVLNIWNYYNRKPVTLVAGFPFLSSALPASATANYNVTWPTWQDWQGVNSSTQYSAQVLVGYLGDSVRASFSRAWYVNGTSGPAAYECGIGVDTSISLSGSECGLTGDNIASTTIGYWGTANVSLPPFFGIHTLFGIEKLSYQPTGSIQAFENIGNTGLYVTTSY